MDKVENTDYLKDRETGVIVNSNQKDYNNARSRFAKQIMKDKKIKNLQDEVSDLKSNLKKILTLLESKE